MFPLRVTVSIVSMNGRGHSDLVSTYISINLDNHHDIFTEKSGNGINVKGRIEENSEAQTTEWSFDNFWGTLTLQ